MGKTEGPGSVHLTTRLPPDIKEKVVYHVKILKEASSLSDYAARALLYYMEERPIMRELIEGLRDRINKDNAVILEKLNNIESRLSKLEVPEGTPS